MEYIARDVIQNVGTDKMVAIIYNKHKILSLGISNPSTYFKILGQKFQICAKHAEIDAIEKLIFRKRNQTRINCSMIIVRCNADLKFTCSKPCLNCLKVLQSNLIQSLIHFKKIKYFDRNGKIKSEQLNEISTTHMSRGWRLYYNKYIN